MNVEDIRKFKDTHFGWFRPDGSLVACALFDHLAVLGNVPELADAVAAYTDVVNENEQAMLDDLASLGPDDHPEMHRFHGMNDDAQAKLTRAAYQAGWIRLGLHLDRSIPLPSGGRPNLRAFIADPTNWVVEAEGVDEEIEKHRRLLAELAEMVDAKLVLRKLNPVDLVYTI